MKSLKYYFLLLIFFSTYAMFANNPSLKPAMTIGNDDQDDYMFFRIKSAIMANDGSIFIADIRGAFVSKFDRNGKFIKRVGQRGKGPGDFIMPKAMQIFEDKIFIMDSLNQRIAYSDLDLSNFKYFRTALFDHKTIDFGGKFLYSFRVVNRKKMLVVCPRRKETQGYDFFSVNRELKVDDTYFTLPSVISTQDKSQEDSKKVKRFAYCISPKDNRLIAVNKIAENPICFHIYDLDGRLVKRFQHKLPLDIESAQDCLLEPEDSKKRFNLFMITSIHMYRDFLFVFVEQIRNYSKNRDGKHITEPYALIFDTNGKYHAKMLMEKTGEVFSISDNGHLLMQTIRDEDDETIKLTIYKMTL